MVRAGYLASTWVLKDTAHTLQVNLFEMGRRQRLISNSILGAIFSPKKAYGTDDRPSLFARILAFFAVFNLALARYRAALFRKLRNEIWAIDEEEYKESCRSSRHNKRTDLVAVGDLGYSGSVCKPLPIVYSVLPTLFRHSSRPQTLSSYSNHSLATSNKPSSATAS
jgi:hypothetical protein